MASWAGGPDGGRQARRSLPNPYFALGAAWNSAAVISLTVPLRSSTAPPSVGAAAGARADADELAALLPKEGWAQLEAARITTPAAEPSGEGVGDKEHALGQVKRTVRLRPDLRAALSGDPELKSLQGDARFRALSTSP